MKVIINTCIALLLGVSSFAQTINSNKSVVNFEIGNLGFNIVDGTFKKMTGEVIFNSSELSKANFDVCVESSTVNTRNKKRDNHLKKEDFFDVEKYPKICFKSESITIRAGEYLSKGKLTMHGISKQIEIPFAYVDNTFTGSFTVNRYDYNIGSQTSKMMVSQKVEIEIVCVMN